MDMSESEVQQLLDLLLRKHFLRTLSGFGNRVVKYEQRFCNSEFGQLKLSPAELAVIATLLLRGAQTPGELRTRTNRMHEFNDVSEVEQVLQQLATREDGRSWCAWRVSRANAKAGSCICSAARLMKRRRRLSLRTTAT